VFPPEINSGQALRRRGKNDFLPFYKGEIQRGSKRSNKNKKDMLK